VSILDAIPLGSLVALDTVVWIYEFEFHPVFGPVTRTLFRDGFDKAVCRAACSLLVLGEVLVQPLVKSRTDLADQYRLIISQGPDLTVWPIGRDVIETAAFLRAKYRIKMIDAIQVASAVVYGADVFVTNDAGLRRISEVPILILSDYLPASPASGPPVSP
jgi:predicted nucleic acid-binding protein